MPYNPELSRWSLHLPICGTSYCRWPRVLRSIIWFAMPCGIEGRPLLLPPPPSWPESAIILLRLPVGDARLLLAADRCRLPFPCPPPPPPPAPVPLMSSPPPPTRLSSSRSSIPLAEADWLRSKEAATPFGPPWDSCCCAARMSKLVCTPNSSCRPRGGCPTSGPIGPWCIAAGRWAGGGLSSGSSLLATWLMVPSATAPLLLLPMLMMLPLPPPPPPPPVPVPACVFWCTVPMSGRIRSTPFSASSSDMSSSSSSSWAGGGGGGGLITLLLVLVLLLLLLLLVLLMLLLLLLLLLSRG
uniref:Uncharacterized protein n=1 Tax=Anopheles coluzzii TaxID=1518534 RepID=A0A8W7PHW3_ANOCL